MRAAAAFLLTLASLATAQDKCYYPEGNEATDYTYTPCAGVNTTFSQCCLLDQGDRCLPNGLCYYGQKNYDYRSACSDKSWETCADPCPNYHQDSWINVKACATDQFCCNEDIDNGDCCKDGAERFDLPAPSVTTSTQPPSDPTSAESSAASSTNGEPSSADSQSPSPSNADPQDGDSGGDGGLSTAAQGGIGGAVGGAALLAIGFGAFWFLRRRKGRNVQAAELGGSEPKKGYWGGGNGAQVQHQGQWNGPPAEIEGSAPAVESGGREVPHRYELGG